MLEGGQRDLTKVSEQFLFLANINMFHTIHSTRTNFHSVTYFLLEPPYMNCVLGKNFPAVVKNGTTYEMANWFHFGQPVCIESLAKWCIQTPLSVLPLLTCSLAMNWVVDPETDWCKVNQMTTIFVWKKVALCCEDHHPGPCDIATIWILHKLFVLISVNQSLIEINQHIKPALFVFMLLQIRDPLWGLSTDRYLRLNVATCHIRRWRHLIIAWAAFLATWKSVVHFDMHAFIRFLRWSNVYASHFIFYVTSTTDNSHHKAY